jgi:photosystem II stability/assembly factor-like uncharacterized protein
MGLLVGTVDGVYLLERDETTSQGWVVGRQTLKGTHVSSLLYAGNVLFAGAHSGGLFVSEDDGETWTASGNGISSAHEHVFTLAAQPRDGRIVLWAGTQPAALYRSDDLGRTWFEVSSLQAVAGKERWHFPAPPNIAHVKHIGFYSREPTTLYVCIEQGALLKSTDDGRSWRELTGYVSEHDYWYHDAHRVVVGRKPTKLYLTSGEGIYTSEDAGETWHQLTTRHDRLGYPDALFLDPRSDRILYVAGGGSSPDAWERGPQGTGNPGILRSEDGGKTWAELRDGLPSAIRGNIEAMSMHRWAKTAALFAATTAGDVFASEDRGTEWEQIASGLPPVSKVGHYKLFLAEQKAL